MLRRPALLLAPSKLRSVSAYGTGKCEDPVPDKPRVTRSVPLEPRFGVLACPPNTWSYVARLVRG